MRPPTPIIQPTRSRHRKAPASTRAPSQEAKTDVLPSTPLGTPRPAIAYNVYDVTNPGAPRKITAAPVAEAHVGDNRIVWGEKRCYSVRAAETVGSFTVESEASTPV